MRERTLIGSAATLLAGGGLIVGREGAIWAYGKGLDALSNSIGPAQVTWLEGLPWANIGGSCAMVAGVALGLYSIFQPPKVVALERGTGSATVSSPPANLNHGKPQSIRFLSDAIVVGGHGDRGPEYRARFATNGREAQFYLEYSVFISALTLSGWNPPIKIPIARVDRFAKGETITIPLVRPVQISDGVRWQFGTNMNDGLPIHMIGTNSYRGRIMMLSSEDTTESCYFVLATSRDIAAMPEVIGEHLWAHEHEWEGRAAPNGDAETLFQ